MKHVNMTPRQWGFSIEPFPAFRSEIVYGRHKHDQQFLPVKGISPVTTFTVEGGGVVLYKGTDCVQAQKTVADFDDIQRKKVPFTLSHAIFTVSPQTLPENRFQVIKTKEKGTIMVVPGEDLTRRCLLFAECKGGFRGGVALIGGSNSADVIKKCHAGDACDSLMAVIAILEVDQSIAFHSWGRRKDEVYRHAWDGETIKVEHYSIDEWNVRSELITADVAQAHEALPGDGS